MMPRTKIRVSFFRRHSKVDYISWLQQQAGVNVEDHVYQMSSRPEIDRYIEGLLSPTWVEAALEVEGLEVVSDEITDIEMGDEPEEDIEEPSDDDTSAGSPFTFNDYDSYTIRELQDICRERGLTIRGTKAEVVLRLRRDDDGITETQPEEDETEAPSEEAVEESSDTPSEEAVTEEVNENAADSEQGSDTEEEE